MSLQQPKKCEGCGLKTRSYGLPAEGLGLGLGLQVRVEAALPIPTR